MKSAKRQLAVGVFVLFATAAACLTAHAQEGTFVPTGYLVGSDAQSATFLPSNGKVLVVGVAGDAELYNPAMGTFAAAGSLVAGGGGTNAVLLANGEVLIVGGESNTPNSAITPATAELYDPTTGNFTLTGTPNVERFDFTATLLNNGMVLLAGGHDGLFDFLTSAELYNPATGTFTYTGDMNYPRSSYSATLLTNGMVLVAGGMTDDLSTVPTATAEIYNPATGTFTLTGSMNFARVGQTATLLNNEFVNNNGTVLIAGGDTSVDGDEDMSTTTAELYDPTAGTFILTGSMNVEPAGQTATLLYNGIVLIAGGGGDGLTAEIYNPTTETFTYTGSMLTAESVATLLPNGTVLMVGGEGETPAELYQSFVLSPTSLSFSNQPTGTTSMAQSFTLTSNEITSVSGKPTAEPGVTNITITDAGTNATNFVETNNCIGVATGASCSINVSFTPTATGTLTGTLIIVDTLTPGNPLLASLTGTGIAATEIIRFSTANLTFLGQIVGTTSAAQPVMLSNSGNAPLIISNLAVSGTDASDFAETDNCGGSVAANASCTINITFAPMATGTRTGTLNITDNATSPQSPQTIVLTGTGTPGTPIISLSSTTISFPSQYVGTSGLPQSVTLTNNGNAPLVITSVVSSAADFGLINACGSTVAAGTSCSVGVFFDPTAGGARPGKLTINDNAPGSPQTVALSGAGEDFSLVPTSTSTTVSPGQTASFAVTVSSAGGFNQMVAFTCSGAPALSTCTVSPNSVVLNGSAASTVSVALATTAASALLPAPSPTSGDHPLFLIAELLGLALTGGLFSWRKDRRPRLAYGLALLLLFLGAGMMMSACVGTTNNSGGGSTSGGGNQAPGTPAGTYALTLSGTFSSSSTTLTHNINLTVVVQ